LSFSPDHHVKRSKPRPDERYRHCVKLYLGAGLAAVVIVGGLITAAPPASAGCQYGGIAISRCDGPVQPDGTWQRCVLFNSTYGGLPGDTYSYRAPDKRCDVMGPDLHPWGLAFNDHRRTSTTEPITLGKRRRPRSNTSSQVWLPR
jgi:hypothetical protein